MRGGVCGVRRSVGRSWVCSPSAYTTPTKMPMALWLPATTSCPVISCSASLPVFLNKPLMTVCALCTCSLSFTGSLMMPSYSL